MANDSHQQVDSHTGVTTTGHEWDGIKELNTPLPRWWLWLFYITILFSVGYWVVYPSWPTASSYLPGTFGWNSRSAVATDLAALQASRSVIGDKIAKASLADIEKTPELLSFARAQGAAAFAINCAPCHGAGAQGSKGYANLNDDDWLWGGKLTDIETTLTHGIRWAADKDTRSVIMPSFGKDGILKPAEVSNVADYVRSLSGLETEKGSDLAAGKKIFAENCAACHGDDAKGIKDMGAPNLADKVWLYGSDKATIVERINLGGGGQMPAWVGRLDTTTIKALTVYVHSLGGGQ